MVSVSADGEVFPCHMMHDEAFSLGSLLEDPGCLAARMPLRPRGELAACADCEIRYLCGGGCALVPISPRATSRPAIPIVPSCGRSTVCFLRQC